MFNLENEKGKDQEEGLILKFYWHATAFLQNFSVCPIGKNDSNVLLFFRLLIYD